MGKKLILVTIGVIFAALVALSIVLSLRKPPNINLVMSPSAASARLDGKKPVKPGEFYVGPGQHTISANFEGFAPTKVTFSSPTTGIKKVYVILQPNSPTGISWLESHPEDQQTREGYGGQKFASDSTAFAQSNQIINYLPFVGNADAPFRIDYTSPANPTDPVTIIITYYTEEGKTQALGWLENKGYPVAKNSQYIEFVDKT